MKHYGLPYKGSKSKLADRIMALFPKRTNFYDLFCGGCAMTHAALLGHKFKNVIANDINWMCPTLFADALNGKYKDERRWISREDFERLKDTDPYVAFVWSFGNNLRNYLYGRDIEPFKRALHYAVVFRDYEPMKVFGHDLSFIDTIADEYKRYTAVRHYFRRGKHNPFFVTPSRCGEISHFERTRYFKGEQELAECEEFNPNRGGGIQLESFARTRRLMEIAIPRTPNVVSHIHTYGNLSLHIGDYQNVEIQPDSVIYCDIPYYQTDIYDKNNDFDYERFYDWCDRQTEPLFVSSYEMPKDRFKCVAEWEHRSTLSATANNAVRERVFTPIHQDVTTNRQLTLF